MDEFPQQEILGIIKARVKLSAPSTSEGSHLLAWLTVILEGKHSLDMWLTERVIAIPVENPCFLLTVWIYCLKSM